MRVIAALRRVLDSPPATVSERLLLGALWLPSQLFRMVVTVRDCLYRRGLRQVYRAPVPVVSVGNLTAGGTGKTPVTDHLVKRVLARGVRVAIVSRGYGGSCREDVGKVADGSGRLFMSPGEAGDEPYLLASRNPGVAVYVARRRRHGVAAAAADGAECVVLDDAFQHRAVARDLDIVLLDARRPFGNGRLLPAGTLREPAAALRRADLLLLTHASEPPAVPFAGDLPVVSCRHRFAEELLDLHDRRTPWESLAGRDCLAFAGIARPEDFFAALHARGVRLAGSWALADHQDYTPDLLKRLVDECDNGRLLLTTEKDAVKLRAAGFAARCLRVPLELDFDNDQPLERALDDVLAGANR